jgi:hypothetical protein
MGKPVSALAILKMHWKRITWAFAVCDVVKAQAPVTAK